MMAPQGLVFETARVEIRDAELREQIDELGRQFRAQQQQADADRDQRLHAIDAQYRHQIAQVAGQLEQSLRESIDATLRQKRDLERDALWRVWNEEANERRKRYDELKQKYNAERFALVNLMMSAGLAPSPVYPPASSPRPSEPFQLAPAVPASGLAALVESHAAPPVVAEVPSQLDPVPSQPATPIPAETNSQLIIPQYDGADDIESAVEQGLAAHRSDVPSVPVPHEQPSKDGQEKGVLASPVKSPSPPPQPAIAAPALEQETLPSKPAMFDSHQDKPSHSPRASPKLDPAPKRKANSEVNDQSPAASPSRVKRTKLEKAARADGPTAAQPSPVASQRASDRTVSYEDVYGAPGKPVQYRHIIVQFPVGNGSFYILRCDQHGVHFGEHPLRGAAKHLASAQHGFMSKAHATAIQTLGHRVLGCTKELAEQNNRQFLAEFKSGAYKVFNANNLSQTRRAELGYPPLDPLNSQKVALHRKQTAGVPRPVPCKFYVVNNGDLKCPVVVLPWGDASAAGLVGSLADIGLFRNSSEQEDMRGPPKLPKCYVYDEVENRITGIRGWAKGYEDGGPLERKREFPVLCVESTDTCMWSVGWVKATHLSPLDFDDPSSRSIPFIREARDYHNKVLRPHQVPEDGIATPRQAAHQSFREGARSAAGEDVEMEDVSGIHNDFDGDSDQDSSKAMSDSDNGVGRVDAESRRTSISNREDATSQDDAAKPTSASAPAHLSSAQLIAAQALNLGTPPRAGFTAINAASTPDGSASRSARASPEPPSRAGSVSSAGGGHRRVIKIHARSNPRHPTNQTHASPSSVLPERPAERTILPSGAGQSEPLAEVRKPSPASLQNILHPANGPPRVGSQSPKPANGRRPLPSAPMRGGSPARAALLSAVNTKLTQPLRDNRAGSAPVQVPQHRDLVAEELRRSGSASAAPGSSRHATPQPASQPAPQAAPHVAPEVAPQTAPEPTTAAQSAPELAPAPAPAPEPAQTREQPPQSIQFPPPPTHLPPLLHLNTTPLATPTPSAGNTRPNSPTLTQPKTGTPSTAATTAGIFPKPADTPTPTLTPTPTSQPGAFLPTMDVFDLAGFMDGGAELFRSVAPGQYLRLIDDHQSGVFTTPSDAPVQVRIEPKRVRAVERVAALGGAVCVVTIVYREEGEGGGEGEEEGKVEKGGGEPHTQTLVLEKARSTASGMLNGMVHARRLCRRLQAWNAEIVCPSPGSSLDSVKWRFDGGGVSSTGSPVVASPSVEVGAVVGEEAK